MVIDDCDMFVEIISIDLFYVVFDWIVFEVGCLMVSFIVVDEVKFVIWCL